MATLDEIGAQLDAAKKILGGMRTGTRQLLTDPDALAKRQAQQAIIAGLQTEYTTALGESAKPVLGVGGLNRADMLQKMKLGPEPIVTGLPTSVGAIPATAPVPLPTFEGAMAPSAPSVFGKSAKMGNYPTSPLLAADVFSGAGYIPEAPKAPIYRIGGNSFTNVPGDVDAARGRGATVTELPAEGTGRGTVNTMSAGNFGAISPSQSAELAAARAALPQTDAAFVAASNAVRRSDGGSFPYRGPQFMNAGAPGARAEPTPMGAALARISSAKTIPQQKAATDLYAALLTAETQRATNAATIGVATAESQRKATLDEGNLFINGLKAQAAATKDAAEAKVLAQRASAVEEAAKSGKYSLADLAAMAAGRAITPNTASVPVGYMGDFTKNVPVLTNRGPNAGAITLTTPQRTATRAQVLFEGKSKGKTPEESLAEAARLNIRIID